MIFIAYLLVVDEKPAFPRFLMPEMTFMVHIHRIYKPETVLCQVYRLKVDSYT